MKWYENSRVRMRAFRSRLESGRSGVFREIRAQPATHASTAAAANNRAWMDDAAEPPGLRPGRVTVLPRPGWVWVPTPVTHQRHIFSIAGDVLAMFDQPGLHFVLEVIAAAGELWQAVDDVLDKGEAVHIVQYRHIEGGRDRAFLLVSAHMQVHVVLAAVCEAMDEPWIPVEGEDDGFVLREERIEVGVAQPMRMLSVGLQSHQIHDIHDTDLQFRQRATQDRYRGEGFQRRHIPRAGHHHVRFAAGIVARPGPHADTLGAMLDRRIHGQPLRRRVLSSHHNVDVMAAAQTVVHYR